MKKILVLLLIGLLISFISAINLKVEKQSSDEVMIGEIDNPASFDLRITNSGPADSFLFYNLLGFGMAPKGTVLINKGETKNVKLMIYPRENFDFRGFYTFQYFIQAQDSSEIAEELTVEIIDLKDAFEVGSGEIDPELNSLEIYIHNKKNFNFEKINVAFSSNFFNVEKEFSLGGNQREDFDVQLNKDDFKKLMAGFYTLNAEVMVGDKKANVEGIIKFIEKDIVTTTKKQYGFIINTKIIKKTNEGNVLAKSEIIIKKNIISRLFTSFSPEPDVVERQGAEISYTWNKEIKPGESLEIVVKTNWLLPLLLILFVVVIVILVKQYSKTDLILKKRVSFVKAKGGEFALKVSVLVNAKKYIERINIIDKLPNLVKVYERFGGEKPSKIDEKNKKIEWYFEKLEQGETRMMSYIVYSKIGVVGKFALPSASAIYEKEGEIHESESNKAFFIAEQKDEGIEE